MKPPTMTKSSSPASAFPTTPEAPSLFSARMQGFSVGENHGDSSGGTGVGARATRVAPLSQAQVGRSVRADPPDDLATKAAV